MTKRQQKALPASDPVKHAELGLFVAKCIKAQAILDAAIDRIFGFPHGNRPAGLLYFQQYSGDHGARAPSERLMGVIRRIDQELARVSRMFGEFCPERLTSYRENGEPKDTPLGLAYRYLEQWDGKTPAAKKESTSGSKQKAKAKPWSRIKYIWDPQAQKPVTRSSQRGQQLAALTGSKPAARSSGKKQTWPAGQPGSARSTVHGATANLTNGAALGGDAGNSGRGDHRRVSGTDAPAGDHPRQSGTGRKARNARAGSQRAADRRGGGQADREREPQAVGAGPAAVDHDLEGP